MTGPGWCPLADGDAEQRDPGGVPRDRLDAGLDGADVGHGGRGGDDEDRVRLAAVQQDAESGGIGVGAGGCAEVDRVGGSGQARECGDQGCLGGRREGGHVESGCLGLVGGHHAEAAGVADDRQAGPGRERLVGEQRGGVDHVLHAVDLDHAGGAEQRPQRACRRGVRGGVGRTRPGSGDGAATEHHQQRLGAAEGCGQAGERARVEERLEVQAGHTDVVVVGPRGQQVVAGDIGLVAQRHHAGESGVAGGHGIQDGDADPARLGADGEPTGRRAGTAETRVQRRGAQVADQSETVGSDDAHAVCSTEGEHALLVGARLRRAARW